MSIAPHISKYFWDVDPKKASPKSHSEYYIKRILELGDKRAFDWLRKVFGKTKILRVLKKSNISPKSKNYWNITLH